MINLHLKRLLVIRLQSPQVYLYNTFFLFCLLILVYCLVIYMQWLNNCVGRKNYVTFVCLMAVSLVWVKINSRCISGLFLSIDLYLASLFSSNIVIYSWFMMFTSWHLYFACLSLAHFWGWSWHSCPCSMLRREKSNRTPDLGETWRSSYPAPICYCSGMLPPLPTSPLFLDISFT